MATPEREQRWYFTFGFGHAHPDRFVVIEGRRDDAREKMFEAFGRRWAFQYGEAEWNRGGRSQAERYGLVELALPEPSPSQNATMPTYGLDSDYPLLTEKSREYDFAERLGGCSDPLMAEIDAAMRELWSARGARAAAEATEPPDALPTDRP